MIEEIDGTNAAQYWNESIMYVFDRYFVPEKLARDDSVESTLVDYRRDTKTLVEFMKKRGIEPLISNVSHATVNLYLVDLKKQKLADNTKARRKSSLKSFFTFLYGQSPFNPFFNVIVRKSSRKAERISKVLSEQQQLELLNAALKIGYREYVFFLMALKTGMRPSELCNLRWEDFDFETKRGHFKRLKEGRLNAIPLSQEFINELLKFKVSPVGGTEYVFKTRESEPMSTSTYKRFYPKVFNLAELHGFQFRDLRKTFATKLYRLTKNIVLVQSALGHSSVETTLTYLGVSLEEVRKDLENLQNSNLDFMRDKISRLIFSDEPEDRENDK